MWTHKNNKTPPARGGLGGSAGGGKDCVCPGPPETVRLNPGLNTPLCESLPPGLVRSGTPGYRCFVESLGCSGGRGCPPPSLWLQEVTPILCPADSPRLWKNSELSYSARCALSVTHDRASPVAAPSPAGFQTPCLLVFSTADREKTCN